MGTSSRGADLIVLWHLLGTVVDRRFVDGFLPNPTAIPGQET